MNASHDRYGRDLSIGPSCHPSASASKVATQPELVVEHAGTGRCGAVFAGEKVAGASARKALPSRIVVEGRRCPELGRPHATQAAVARREKGTLGTVRAHADLEPARPGRVEELLDVVMLGARA